MKNQIAVSFEDEFVKIAYGIQNNGTFAITRTLTLRNEEFDDFLVREKTKNFIVTCHFSSFYQNIFSFPPTQEKYLTPLVQLEIKKNNPGFKHFTFFYTALRERLHEGRMVQDIFVFAVDNNEIMRIIDRFTKYGKRISKLFPDVVSLTRFITLKDDMAGATALCVLDSGKEKTLWLVKDGNISFMRVVQSRKAGFDEYDVNNINMTVNYARQAMRENPSKIILINPQKINSVAPEGLVLPATIMEFPPGIVLPEEERREFALPVAALFLYQTIKRENLLPYAYKSFQFQRTIINACTGFFIICSILGMGYVIMKSFEAYGVREYFAPLREEIRKRQAIYTEYEERKKKLERYIPLIKYMNDEFASPDIQRALIALQSFSHENVLIKEIALKNDRQLISLQLKGIILAKTYTQLQSNFQVILSYVKNVEGIEIASRTLDLKTKDFSLDLRWKT